MYHTNWICWEFIHNCATFNAKLFYFMPAVGISSNFFGFPGGNINRVSMYTHGLQVFDVFL